MEKKPVTLIDIANILGVSKSTVSRSLKNHPDISNQTKAAVWKIANELNYVKNTAASSLRFKKSNLIGIIVPEISYFFFPSIIQGVENIVRMNGYNILMLQSNESYEREVENVNILISNNVEGVLASISLETENVSHFNYVTEMNIPLVIFDRIAEGIYADVVLVDDTVAAFKAVSHLVDRGKRKIAICTGSLKLLICRNRLEGYKRALNKNGIPINNDLILIAETPEDAEQKLLQLLKIDPSIDGIFAISDLTMAGTMKALYKSNKRIPEEVAVVGFCEEQYRTMYNPSLTAINPMGFEIGYNAAKLLFEQIYQKSNNLPPLEPRTIYLNSNLVKGESS